MIALLKKGLAGTVVLTAIWLFVQGQPADAQHRTTVHHTAPAHHGKRP